MGKAGSRLKIPRPTFIAPSEVTPSTSAVPAWPRSATPTESRMAPSARLVMGPSAAMIASWRGRLGTSSRLVTPPMSIKVIPVTFPPWLMA